jgi:peptide/nickel transport system permease protein
MPRVRAYRGPWRSAWARFLRHRLAVVGTVIVLGISLAAIFAPFLTPYDPDRSRLQSIFEPPSLGHPMGTDDLGRDQLTRVLYGGRVSIAIGLLSMLLSVSLGTLIGALAGYYGGALDNVLMRLTDLVISFPRLFVLILLVSLLGHGISTIIVVIGALSWMHIARLVRAAILSLKQKEFVEAARSCGAGSSRIINRHLLPNAMGPIVVAATLDMARAIVTESGLSYLGLGVQPPTATWGTMLRNAQDPMASAPWTAFFPGFMIFLMVMATNFMGDGLRDALDPRRVVSE